MLVASWLVLLMSVPFVKVWSINKFKVHLLQLECMGYLHVAIIHAPCRVNYMPSKNLD